MRSWTRARARENEVELSDEDDTVDDGDLTSEYVVVEHKPLKHGNSEEPWDLNAQGEPAYNEI